MPGMKKWRDVITIGPAVSLMEVDEAYDLAARVFGPTYPEAVARLTLVRFREGLESPGDVLVARCKAKIVGMVQVLPRRMYFSGKVVQAFGLGHVCVDPSLQGRGYGGRLVTRALQLVHEREGLFAIVIARRAVDGFYSKYGFAGIDGFAEICVASRGTFLQRRTNLLCLRSETFENVKTMARAYRDTYSRMEFSFCRSERWWKHFGARLGGASPDSEVIDVRAGGASIGYGVLSKGVVIELAAVKAKWELVLQAVLPYLLKDRPSGARFALALSHPCMAYLQNVNHTIALRFAWDGGHMIRIMNERALMPSWSRQGGGIARKNISSSKTSKGNKEISRHRSAREALLQGFSRQSVSILGVHPVWSILDEF